MTDLTIWHPTLTLLRDKEVNIDFDNRYRCIIPSSITHHMAERLRDNECMTLQTNGNGKCGLHALLGTPNAYGELQVNNEEEVMQTILPSSLDAMSNKLDASGLLLLKNMMSTIWSDYVTPFFEKKNIKRSFSSYAVCQL